ncbi:MAG: Gfo/Idh/MocA family oxidoreductase [Sedimentisphaerales bacterium]|nr:Gfo/Idh/MocA family oxidoreductase [Sedimentisphaerales bacterium]
MQTELNLGVIGCGYWGPNLIRNFQNLPECRVKTVCDLDTKRLQHMQDLYPRLKATTDADQIIDDDDIQATVIVTPVSLHYDLARRSLLADKHVFVEKPMATSTAECAELVELARQKQRTLMVGHTFIFTPVVRRIKEIIASGDIGEICYVSSRRLNLGLFQKDINVTWDLAPHDISIILFWLNQMPRSVNCQGKAHMVPGIEDVTNLSLNFHNGKFAAIQSSWLDPNKIREMTIVGTKKMIVYNDMEPLEKIKIFDKRVETPPHYDTFGEFQYSYHYGDTYSPYVKQVEPLKLECQNFIDCIRSGDKPESSGLEGMQVVQILEASSQSLRQNGAEVVIRPPAACPTTEKLSCTKKG